MNEQAMKPPDIWKLLSGIASTAIKGAGKLKKKQINV
jgi:hypothetical protein